MSAPNGKLPFLSEKHHKKLDDEFQRLAEVLALGPAAPYEGLVHLLRKIVAFAEGKLLHKSWDDTWRATGHVSWAWFCGDEGGVHAELLAVFTWAVRILMDGALNLHRREEWKKDLAGAVEDYLVVRGRPTRCLETSITNDCATICRVGDRLYRVGQSGPVLVSQSEDLVLRAFFSRPVLDHCALIANAGEVEESAPRVLRKLKTKHGGVFSQAIHLPGGKGRGGYRARVVDLFFAP